MERSSLEMGDTVTPAAVRGQQATKASVMTAGKIDMTALIEIHKETENFWGMVSQLSMEKR